MRRWPTVNPRLGVPLRPPTKTGEVAPPNLGDVIEPFLQAGGATFYIVTDVGVGFDPRPAGVQLCAHVYVPFGKTGFVKQVRVAPFIPPVLVDPWETSGASGTPDASTSWKGFDDTPATPVRPGGRNGVWETPFGWESYFDVAGCAEQPPQWTWELRMAQGNIVKDRPAAFSLLDPATWALVPDIAVPLSAYPSGIPGDAPSGFWGPQRMQVIQGDELTTHVVVPENHTICLFTRWTQNRFQPQAYVQTEGSVLLEPIGDSVYPLLPSFGQLHGYMQAANRKASVDNALHGWGG